MDVSIVRTSPFDLPSKRRVGAIAYDGAVDMRLWRGPGPDRDVDELYGGDLQSFLDQEREKLGIERLGLGEVVRVHRGHLHCDFLAWIGTREPEPGTTQSPAPGRDLLRQAVLDTLSFVAERSVQRIAFPALGEGPQQLDRADRLEIIIRAAHDYEAECFKSGRPPVVEEVLVCEPLGEVIRRVQSRVAGFAKAEAVVAPKKTAAKAKRKPATGRKRKTAKPALDPAELNVHRHTAEKYSIRQVYTAGDWVNHTKFGVGRVEVVKDTQAISVLFEDGTTRNLAHAR